MSLKVDKNNIYVIVPPKSDDITSINKFMENDFTIFVRARIFPEELPYEQDCYIVARNGKHSGICVRKLLDNRILISFSYWINSLYRSNESEYKHITYILPKEWENEFNEYIMTCNNSAQSIYCYVNNEYKGTITYHYYQKEDYSNAFIWFGCGSMIVEPEFKSIGSFEYELAFFLNKNIDINDIYYMKNNYRDHIEFIFDELPTIKDSFMHKDSILFLSDFKHQTQYKLWNYAFNGVFPQLYIENNIYF